MNSRLRAVGFVLAVIGIIGSAASAAAESVHGAHRLVGSWEAAILPAPGVSLPALITFSSDGVVLATESPGPFESLGIGTWVPRDHDAAFTFRALIGSAADGGVNTGRQKVSGLLQYDPATDSWSGGVRVELSPQNVAFTVPVVLTRIVVE